MPDRPVYHYHLSFVLRDRGRRTAAIESLRLALKQNTRFYEARFNLARLLADGGELAEAEQHYRKAILARPAEMKTYNHLGRLLVKRGPGARRDEAEACFRMACKLAPEDPEAYLNLAESLYQRKNNTQAAGIYRQILNLDPLNRTARHMLDKLEGRQQINRASGYISRHFTPYSNYMESLLQGRLDFTGAEKLRWLVGDFLHQQEEISGLALPVSGLDILDLGCADGVNGSLYRSISRKLVGCERSSHLLAQAQKKMLYDHLEEQGAVNYLGRASDHFDVIIASDILVYLGALEGVFAGVARCLKPAGIFAFCIETQGTRDFSSGAYGRFSHSLEYITRLCQQNNFNPRMPHDTILRRNGQGRHIKASLYVVQKTDARRVI